MYDGKDEVCTIYCHWMLSAYDLYRKRWNELIARDRAAELEAENVRQLMKNAHCERGGDTNTLNVTQAGKAAHQTISGIPRQETSEEQQVAREPQTPLREITANSVGDDSPDIPTCRSGYEYVSACFVGDSPPAEVDNAYAGTMEKNTTAPRINRKCKDKAPQRQCELNAASYIECDECDLPCNVCPAQPVQLIRRMGKESEEDKFDVKQAGRKGVGVYARHPLAKGEKLFEYTGEYISSSAARGRVSRNRAAGKATYLMTLYEKAEDMVAKEDVPEVKWRSRVRELRMRASIDAERYGNISSCVNHSCSEANIAPFVWRGRDGLYHAIFEATRDVDVGEELTYNYGYGSGEGDCQCLKRACTGSVGKGV